MRTLYFLELDISYKKKSNPQGAVALEVRQNNTKWIPRLKKISPIGMRLIGWTIILGMQLGEESCLTCYFVGHFVTPKNWTTACEFSCSVSLYSQPKIPCDASSVNNTCKVHPAWLGALNVLLQRMAKAHIKRAIMSAGWDPYLELWPLKAGGKSVTHEESGWIEYFLRMCN